VARLPGPRHLSRSLLLGQPQETPSAFGDDTGFKGSSRRLRERSCDGKAQAAGGAGRARPCGRGVVLRWPDGRIGNGSGRASPASERMVASETGPPTRKSSAPWPPGRELGGDGVLELGDLAVERPHPPRQHLPLEGRGRFDRLRHHARPHRAEKGVEAGSADLPLARRTDEVLHRRAVGGSQGRRGRPRPQDREDGAAGEQARARRQLREGEVDRRVEAAQGRRPVHHQLRAVAGELDGLGGDPRLRDRGADRQRQTSRRPARRTVRPGDRRLPRERASQPAQRVRAPARPRPRPAWGSRDARPGGWPR
jgi:hypothetical protein